MTTITLIRQPFAYVPILAALHAEAFHAPWSEQAFSSALGVAGTHLITASAERPDQPVGFLLYRQIVDEAEILTIMVRPLAHRQGHGKRLLDTVISTAQINGARVVFLEVDIDNQAARNLYQAADFTAIGQRQGYFKTAPDRRSDAIVMQRVLPANGPDVSVRTVDGSHQRHFRLT